MAVPSWPPTQQVRALLLLHECAALLAVEARTRSLQGSPQLAAQLAAVGKRTLPQTLSGMTEWSPLRLAGGRESLRTAIGQFTGSSAWAERVTADAVLLLRQGARFSDAGHRVDDLARAIAAADVLQAQRWFEHQLTLMCRHCADHREEDAHAAEEAWSPAIERLLKAAATLNISVTPPAPASIGPPARPPTADMALAASSTPYPPSSATEPGTASGGSQALRRKR